MKSCAEVLSSQFSQRTVISGRAKVKLSRRGLDASDSVPFTYNGAGALARARLDILYYIFNHLCVIRVLLVHEDPFTLKSVTS